MSSKQISANRSDNTTKHEKCHEWAIEWTLEVVFFGGCCTVLLWSLAAEPLPDAVFAAMGITRRLCEAKFDLKALRECIEVGFQGLLTAHEAQEGQAQAQ